MDPRMPLDHYDPDVPPAAREWLGLDETTRLELALAFHAHSGARLPNARLHSAIHVVVENQLALGEPTAVGQTLGRLQREGLTRHDAIHAIGGAISELLVDASQTPEAQEVTRRYEERLARLSARAFLNPDD